MDGNAGKAYSLLLVLVERCQNTLFFRFNFITSVTAMDITDYFDPQQIDAMLEHAKTCNPRYYLVLRLLWRSGVRVSELRAVKPSDVEPQN